MPYPNEHSCRLQNPNIFTTFRRANEARSHAGKPIDVIWGIKSSKTSLQALRYQAVTWDEIDAAEHCAKHRGKFEAATSMDVRGVINPLLMA